MYFSFAERGLLIHLTDLSKQENSRKELRPLLTAITCLSLNNKMDYLDGLYYCLELLCKRDQMNHIKGFQWRQDACQVFNRGKIFGAAAVKATVLALLENLLDEISRVE